MTHLFLVFIILRKIYVTEFGIILLFMVVTCNEFKKTDDNKELVVIALIEEDARVLNCVIDVVVAVDVEVVDVVVVDVVLVVVHTLIIKLPSIAFIKSFI